MTIGATLGSHARRRPRGLAIVCDGVAVTWADLAGAVDQRAAEIAAHTPMGGSVALDLENSPHLLVLFLAAAISGREAQVLDPAWPESVRAGVIDVLRPDLMYTGRSGAAGGFAVDAGAAVTGAQLSGRPHWPALDPQSSFYVGFTSGSTGRPKGYRRSHRSWIESFAADAREFGITAQDVVLAPGAMTHSLFLYAAVHALQIGATLLMCRRFRPDAALALARRHGATVLYAAPTQLRMLLDAAADGAAPPPLRWALSSGAKWFPEASKAFRQRFPTARFAEFYGASELSFVTVRKDDEDCPRDSVGRAFSGVRIAIRMADGSPAPVGAIGRIFVESPFLFSGYAMGEGALTRHGDELCIGDLGRLDECGFLWLAGRENRLIVTSGKNVYPEEIERHLMSHPAVAAAAVFGVPDALRGERLVALLTLRAGRSVTRRDLLGHLRLSIPLSLIPRRFGLVQQWRWTASGKSDFTALRALWDAGSFEPTT